MTDTLTNWKKVFFQDNQIEADHPDGRPLYAYRLSDEQFQDLRSALSQYIGGISRIDSKIEHHPHFSGLFLLFAAEWWRREYRGGRWKWHPIEDAIGLDSISWNPSLRGRTIERGLRYWRLPSEQREGLRYIGAVALQGGLPLSLLAEGKGRLGLVLQRVLRLARKGSPNRADLLGWVESLSGYLPDTYKDTTIYNLLVDLIGTITALVENAKLAAVQDAVRILDERQPGWRSRLPLPLDDQTAQGLIDQLIHDAVNTIRTPSVMPVLVRHLDSVDGDFFLLNSSLDLPERLGRDVLCSLFQAEEYALGRRLTLSLKTPSGELSWSLTRLAGSADYHVQTLAHLLSGEAACSEHRLHLASAMGEQWTTWPRRGDALDAALPWLFEEEEDEAKWRYVGQGGGSIQSLHALIAVPEGSQVDPVDDRDNVVFKGFIEEPLRELYLCRGHCQIVYGGEKWRLRTGRADATEADYHWQARPVWLDFIRPALAFYGPLTLLEGDRRINANALEWSPGGSPSVLGLVTVTYRENGEIRYRTRLVHLPNGAALTIRPADSRNGSVVLTGWGAILGRLSDSVPDGVLLESVRDDQTLILSFRTDSSQPPPEQVEVELYWSNNITNPARLRLPFPASGVNLYDGQGKLVDPGSWLSLRRLPGTRLITLGRQPGLQLRFTLRRPGNRLDDSIEVRYPLKAEQVDSRIELRLIDYLDEIQRLLGVDDRLDAWVEMALESLGERVFQLRLSRYLCRLEKREEVVLLTNEGLSRTTQEEVSSLKVLALRLESPKEDPEELDPITSEGTATGSWRFAPEPREPGSWLVYPGEGAHVLFRPTLCPVEGEVTTDSALTQAITVADREQRVSALDEVISEMATDLNHQGWTELELYHQHLTHLPLAALDLWRRLAQSPRAMAVLALRMGAISDDFLIRFAVELPFAWGLIPASHWYEAALRLKQQCEGWFDDSERASRLFMDRLNERIEWVVVQAPAATTLLHVVLNRATNNMSQDMAFLQSPAAEPVFAAQLFIGDDCELQRMVRRHADEHWPNTNDLFEHIRSGRTDRWHELFAN
ncbi:MAG: STY4851/ECs_5259 family protein [Candidatus Thiodiazotropha sp.]